MTGNSEGRRMHRVALEVIPAVVGLATAALITVMSSHSALGVVPRPNPVQGSLCVSAATDCSQPFMVPSDATSDGPSDGPLDGPLDGH